MGIASVGGKPCLASTAESQIPDHPLAADITDQFSSQQVKLFAVIASCVSFILRLDPLHLCKQLFPDDRRAATLNADVAVLLGVFAAALLNTKTPVYFSLLSISYKLFFPNILPRFVLYPWAFKYSMIVVYP